LPESVEVIVVDGFSSDGTAEIAVEKGFQLIQAHGHRLTARSIGWIRAKGEYVLLLDSDQIPSNRALLGLLEVIERVHADAFILRETSGKRNSWERGLTLLHEIEFMLGEGIPRCIRRSILARFETSRYEDFPHIHAEDQLIYEFLKKCGARIVALPDVILENSDPDMVSVMKKQFMYTRTGTQEGLLGDFFQVSWRSSLRKFSPFAVTRACSSESDLLIYYAVLLTRTIFQVAGIVVSRISLHKV
jgi:glycosyltransferase involved in cell wall biosynthesis